MPTEGMPAAEIDVDEPLVAALLAEQHPDLAALPLVSVASGWDNVLVRLGDDLAVRLPRRRAGAPLVENEQRWLPGLARHLPLPVPAPVRVGLPGCGYPWAWSVCPWFPGEIAASVPAFDTTAAARALGRFLSALHTPAPLDAPPNPYRGVPLIERDAGVSQYVAQLSDVIDGTAVLALWNELVATPAWAGPPMWLHGDLHPANLLVHEGALSAVIDFGDITAGDPATDLSAAWMMFSPGERSTFRNSAGAVDDSTWARARGWALALSLAYLARSADNPLMERVGWRTLDAVLTGEPEL